jgi:hypothetical protein
MVPTICLRDFGAMVTLPESSYPIGDDMERAMLEATLDVRMGCVVSADPGDPDEGEYIRTASVQAAAIGGPSGNLLP